MKIFRSMRLFLLAALISVVPASSFAGVFISIGIAPPVLPVYVQPPCPEDGLMWTPGYWAYGPDGYYWVPGAWVPAAYPGALWTPPYWGWEGGHYLFHDGYWGAHVGYYGGVNYGFGFMGIGFVGGEWRGGHFAYNTAIVNVNRTVIHNTYINETIVHNNTVINDRHVAFSGGPGGINHPPTPEERQFSNEKHMPPTAVQTQHIQAAAKDPQQRFATNHGRPATVAAARPMTAPAHTAANNSKPAAQGARPEAARPEAARPATQARPETARPATQARPETTRPTTPARTESRPAQQARPESHPAQQARPESRPAPQSHPQSHPAPKPKPEEHEKPHGRGR